MLATIPWPVAPSVWACSVSRLRIGMKPLQPGKVL